MDHERAALESRYHALLALASDEATSWHGIAGERLTGCWSDYSRREARLTSDKDQARMFGRVLVTHDGRLDTLEGDEKRVEVPGTRPVAAPPAPGPAGAGHDESGGKVADGDDPLLTFDDEQILEKIRLRVLGSLPGGAIKVFSLDFRRTDVIRNIAQFRYLNLLQMAGPVLREHVLEPGTEPKRDDGPDKRWYSFKHVSQAIAVVAGRKSIGEFTEHGVGVWEGEPEASGEIPILLVGKGEASYWNGERKLIQIFEPEVKNRILDFETTAKPWFDHQQIAGYLERCEKDRSFITKTRDDAVGLFSKWCWKYPEAPYIAAGLAFSAWTQACWHYRPQVAVTGPSNSGKTFLFSALEGLYGNLCCKDSKPSEASLRGKIGRTSKVVLVDEFEQDKHRAGILEMIRASSRGDTISRSSSSQKIIEYKIKHMIWVAAIEAGLKKEPDRNRFVRLELAKPPKNLRGKLSLPSTGELRELGQRMLACAVHAIGAAKPLAERLKSCRFEGVHDRIIEGFSVPVAMLAVMDQMSDERAIESLKAMLDIANRDGQEEFGDEDQLLEEILMAQIYHKGFEMTVSQLLEDSASLSISVPDQESAKKVLAASGLRWCEFRDGNDVLPRLRGQKALAVAHNAVSKHLLNGRSGVLDILKRIPDSQITKRTIGGRTANCVLIPESYLKENLLSNEKLDSPGSNFV